VNERRTVVGGLIGHSTGRRSLSTVGGTHVCPPNREERSTRMRLLVVQTVELRQNVALEHFWRLMEIFLFVWRCGARRLGLWVHLLTYFNLPTNSTGNACKWNLTFQIHTTLAQQSISVLTALNILICFVMQCKENCPHWPMFGRHVTPSLTRIA